MTQQLTQSKEIKTSSFSQLLSLFEPLSLNEKVEVCRRFQHITNKTKSALLQQAIKETRGGSRQIGD